MSVPLVRGVWVRPLVYLLRVVWNGGELVRAFLSDDKRRVEAIRISFADFVAGVGSVTYERVVREVGLVGVVVARGEVGRGAFVVF